MQIYAFLRIALLSQLLLFLGTQVYAQEVPIENFTVDANGQVRLEVSSTSNKYYILNVKHDLVSTSYFPVSMTLGEVGTTIITEPLGNYSIDHYQVVEHSINAPADSDLDGIDDITEYHDQPTQSPLNAAPSIGFTDGLVAIDSVPTFNSLSVQNETVQWSEYLNGKEFVKFIILDFNTTHPKTYFINTNTHSLHVDFATVMGVDHLGPDVRKGHIIYHPAVVSSNGTLGTFAFNYSNAESMNFETVQRTQELLAAAMPFLENNLSYFINEDNETDYNSELTLYQDSRVSVLFETDVYAGIDYWGLNQTEGYGYFRQVSLNEIPGSRDIVLYESLPNSLPRVGGIITSVIQTPLSHVNLRAIQDNIPNAFIRDPLLVDSITDLLDHYIYFKADQSNYIIREATLAEVNAWHDKNRPDHAQTPPLNLDLTSILPLDSITFDMYDGFGAKCANVATMRTFGFQDGTIPDGFGVPFYFYQEFMEYNNFFQQIEWMRSNVDFNNDRDIRNDMLEDFREQIEMADMPTWMLNELADMHASFPAGTSVRCRSSTNNEDLPGFSGAGLYSSKTQHPSEGHISKSIKQVYASLWNLRAFDEREFYRVNHFVTSMGVLCHPNHSNEKINGVGVSSDPLYAMDSVFFLNSQIGSDLITNPSNNSRPEEVLVNRYSTNLDDHLVINYSSLINEDTLLLTESQLNLLIEYLAVIHDEFAEIYDAVGNETFAMDIEYKITSDDRLVIKQARPWVSYEHRPTFELNDCDIVIFPNPATENITVQCDDCSLTGAIITDLTGKIVQQHINSEVTNTSFELSIVDLPTGLYIVRAFAGETLCRSRKFMKR